MFISPIAFSCRYVGGQWHSNQSAMFLFRVIVFSSCCQPLLIEDKVISILSVIRHASAPQESQANNYIACTPPRHRSFHSGGSLASLATDMSEEDSKSTTARCLLSHWPHMLLHVEWQGLGPCYVSAGDFVVFGRGVGVINVCSSINGQPGPTQSLSPTISMQGFQIFCIRYYIIHQLVH